MNHPDFITLEGGEGAGKSTQAPRIARWLEARGRRVCLTRQPGGTVLAEELRRLLKRPGGEAIAPATELLLLFAARAQFLAEVVRPALADGQVVVCDRFTDSTYAYQGGGRGVPEHDIAVLEQLVHGDLQPGITLWFDLDLDTALARVAERGHADRFEREDRDFFLRVNEAYRRRALAHPERIERVAADGHPDEVWTAIESILERRWTP